MGIAQLFTQAVSVETFNGEGTYGATYAAAVDVACYVSDRLQLGRSSTAVELVNATTLYAPLAAIDQFAPGSRVTVNGRTLHVDSVYRRDAAGPPDAWHAQVTLI